MTECAGNDARYFDTCLAQKILRIRLNLQSKSEVCLRTLLQLFMGKILKLPLLIVLLETFKAVYKMKMFSADDSNASQVTGFFTRKR